MKTVHGSYQRCNQISEKPGVGKPSTATTCSTTCRNRHCDFSLHCKVQKKQNSEGYHARTRHAAPLVQKHVNCWPKQPHIKNDLMWISVEHFVLMDQWQTYSEKSSCLQRQVT